MESGWVPPSAFGPFRLVQPLGGGAMGVVYLCHDTLLDRLVAVKFIRNLDADAQDRERLLTEARAIARITHPNVVAIHQVGELLGYPYLVYEWVRGEGLDRLKRPIPWTDALRIGIGLARGLGAAHRRGVLHRDIKPANALLGEDGEVKLLDFGLAKLGLHGRAGGAPPAPLRRELLLDETVPRAGSGGRDAGRMSLTESGGLLGTPRYMAPEAWHGEQDRRSDLYSLGVLLYELVAGTPPHGETTLEALRQAAQERDPPPLGTLAPAADPRFCAMVDRCLRRDPEARFPSAEALCDALLQLAPAPALPAAEGPPYRGLQPFYAEHRGLFFGREAEVRAIAERLRADPLVVVTGDSGVGKSSLCHAGVVPLVEEGPPLAGRRFRAVSLVPGKRPLSALCAALAAPLGQEESALLGQLRRLPGALQEVLRGSLPPAAGVLIYIDQMEELVTQSEREEAALFCEALQPLFQHRPEVRILCSLRSDFLTRVAARAGLQELGAALYLLGPLSPEGLRESIVAPARARGYAFESEELVEQLLDATDPDGGLPLLQFALAALWEARDADRRVIPAAPLQRMGGVAGALARHADQVVAALLPAQRRAARRLLCRLVTVEGTRQRRAEAELLGPDEEERPALAALLRGRLLVARQGGDGEGTYELAHEVLLRGWATLQKWLDEDQERLAVHQRLATAAAEWERVGRSGEALWGEPQLREAEQAGLVEGELSARDAAFLATSRGGATRRRRLRRGLILGGPLLGAALLILLLQWQRTEAMRRREAQLMLQEIGLQATSLAQQPGKEVEALLAGVRAVAPDPVTPSKQAVAGLLAAVAQGRRSLPLRAHGAPVRWMAFSPDGSRLVSVGDDKNARLWDARSGALLATVPTRAAFIYRAAYSPDGRKIAVPTLGDATWLLDADGGAPRHLKGASTGVLDAAFSPDSRLLVSASGGGHTAQPIAEVWDVHTGHLVHTLRGHSRGLNAVAFSPDGGRLLTTSADRTARLWSVPAWAPLATLAGHDGNVFGGSFSPDGARVLTISGDHTARLWDAYTGRELSRLAGHTEPVIDGAFSPDGGFVLTVARDGARLWDARTGSSLLKLESALDSSYSVAIFPDGTRAVVAGDSGVARIFDLRTGQLLDTLSGHRGPVYRVSVSPDGQRIATVSHDGAVRLWHGGIGKQSATLRGHAEGLLVARFSPAGDLLLTAASDGTARLWDGRSGRPLALLGGHSGMVHAAFSPDGMLIATGGEEGSTRVWDGRTGRAVRLLSGPAGAAIRWITFSPDRVFIIAAGTDGIGRLWDLRTPAPPSTLSGVPGSMARALFSPDGLSLLTLNIDSTAPGGPRNVYQLWDARSGRPRDVRIEHPSLSVGTLLFTPDGAAFLTSFGTADAALWDARTGRHRATLRGHRQSIWSASISRDGRWVATGGGDGTARLWDARSGQPLGQPLEHAHTVTAVAFSPDGGSLATASYDRLGKLWRVRDQALLAVLAGHSTEVEDVDFSPDGERVVTAGADGTARLWDARTGQPLRADDPADVLSPAIPERGFGTGPAAESPRADPEELRRALAMACRLLRHQQEFSGVAPLCRPHLTSPEMGAQNESLAPRRR